MSALISPAVSRRPQEWLWKESLKENRGGAPHIHRTQLCAESMVAASLKIGSLRSKSLVTLITLQAPVSWCHPSLCSSIPPVQPCNWFLSPSDLTFNLQRLPPSHLSLPILAKRGDSSLLIYQPNHEILGGTHWVVVVGTSDKEMGTAALVVHKGSFVLE